MMFPALLRGLDALREHQAEDSREAHRLCAEFAEALASGSTERVKVAASALTDFEYNTFGVCNSMWGELFALLKERGLYTEEDDQQHVFGR
jgi:hypothetical protein